MSGIDDLILNMRVACECGFRKTLFRRQVGPLKYSIEAWCIACQRVEYEHEVWLIQKRLQQLDKLQDVRDYRIGPSLTSPGQQ